MDKILVPLEPTEEMIEAGAVNLTRRSDSGKYESRGRAIEAWETMLAAAPTPERRVGQRRSGRSSPWRGHLTRVRHDRRTAASNAAGQDVLDDKPANGAQEAQTVADPAPAAPDPYAKARARQDEGNTFQEDYHPAAPTDHLSAPDSHVRAAQARQARGEGIPGDAILAHQEPAARKDGHSALRVGDGELETFDPHPTSTLPLSAEQIESFRRHHISLACHTNYKDTNLANKAEINSVCDQALREIELERKEKQG